MSILSDIWAGVKTTLIGMKITVPYIARKPVTLHYPHVRKQLPERTRNRLYVNMDDCIGCDQCARACPVNCIVIETAKSVGDDSPGITSNGKKKALWVTRFDIDIAKCCYCGLCVYPCPTECIKMTDVFEFSELERANLLYSYVTLTPEEIVEKSRKAEEAEKELAAKKAAAPPKPAAPSAPKPAAAPAPAVAGDDDKAAKLAALQAKMAAAKAAKEGGAVPATAVTSAPAPSAPAADDDKAAKLAALQAKMAEARARAQGQTVDAPAAPEAPAAPAAATAPAPGGEDPEKAAKLAELKARIAEAKAKKEAGG